MASVGRINYLVNKYALIIGSLSGPRRDSIYNAVCVLSSAGPSGKYKYFGRMLLRHLNGLIDGGFDLAVCNDD